MANLDFVPAFQVLFAPKRFKVLWGGRGRGASWSCAKALAVQGMSEPLRVLCVREFQNSIDDSVHKVIADKIRENGWEGFYDIQKTRIIGRNGTEFIFEGIKNHTSRIKSYEGIDICWAEEAIKISKGSWGILLPTIRGRGPKWPGYEDLGPEVWMTFNPELETDYTYVRWVKDKTLEAVSAIRFPQPVGSAKVLESPSSFVVKMTYADNPWFPEALRLEMLRDKERDYDSYLNIWEGYCLQMLEGVVYAKELRKAQEEDRICNVPWERSVGVETFWDLGRADNTAIWFAQKVAMQTRILEYYEASGEDITHFIKELQARPYIYRKHWLPHDAEHKTIHTKLSVKQQLNQYYPGKVRIVPKLSVEDGVNAARLIFPSCFFDEEKCEAGIQALRHYRYRVTEKRDEKSQLSNKPLHDWASDGADAFRYLAIALKVPDQDSEDIGGIIKRLSQPILDKLTDFGPSLGWMGQ